MKVNKEIRQLSRKMLQDSFAGDGLDRSKIEALVGSMIARKPRNYIDVLKNYKRLLRLEVEKRRARVESASELTPEASGKITAQLKHKYGEDLTAEFAVDLGLLGGVRIRVGSDVWDGTVRSRLQRLQQQL